MTEMEKDAVKLGRTIREFGKKYGLSYISAWCVDGSFNFMGYRNKDNDTKPEVDFYQDSTGNLYRFLCSGRAKNITEEAEGIICQTLSQV